jgi:hypothetical protein
MTTEKILEVLAIYDARFKKEKITPRRMDPKKIPRTKIQKLRHACFLIGGIKEYVKDPDKEGKTGRHLGSLQTLLWCAEWYTLEELMNHNRSNEKD